MTHNQKSAERNRAPSALPAPAAVDSSELFSYAPRQPLPEATVTLLPTTGQDEHASAQTQQNKGREGSEAR